MDNTANENALSKKAQQRGGELSGVLYGPSAPGATDNIAIGGILISVKGESKDTDSRTLTSGAGGDFKSGFIAPGKYKLTFSDPQGKYYHPPMTIKVAGNMEIPVQMVPSGEHKKHKGKHGGGIGWNLSGRVKDPKNKSLSGIEVSIKSTKLEKRTGVIKGIKSAAAKLIKKKGGATQEKEEVIAFKVKTNIFGIFSSDRHLPNGTYIIACYDENGKYKFISQTVHIRNKVYPFLSFIGYTNEVTGSKLSTEDKKEIEDELEKYKEETGKEVKLTEKTKREAPELTEEQATKKLEQISSQTEQKTTPALYIPPEKPVKAARSGPREIGDETKKNEEFSEHEQVWKDAEAQHKQFVEASKHAHEAAQQTARDHLENWKPGYTGSTIWQSQASARLRNSAMSENQHVNGEKTGDGNVRKRRGIPKPSFARGGKNAARAAKKAEEQAMNEVKKGLSVVTNNPVARQMKMVLFVMLGIVIVYLLLFGPSSPSFPGGGGGSGRGTTDGTSPPRGGAYCPSTSGNTDPSTCRYLSPPIDLFSTDISAGAIEGYIERYSPIFVEAGKGDANEFRNRVNYIVDSATQAGLNPALFLGYWKSESRFGTASTRELGCAGDSFQEQVDCAVGINAGSNPTSYPIPNCARSKDANSVACNALKEIRFDEDQTHPVSYPIATFDDYAEAYGPISDGIGNCTSTYNVLLEVAKELQVCSAAPDGYQPGNVPPPPANVRQGIIDTFGITMNGFDQDHLTWAWEKFWDVTNTNFMNLVKGSTIVASSEGLSAQVGCPGDAVAVELGQYTPADFFKFILTHELGHVIQWCAPRSMAFYNDAINAYNIEGGISDYGNNASSCPGTVNVNENYADIIAYYLNPQAGLSSGPRSCGYNPSPPNPFYEDTKFPLHYSTGSQILNGQGI